MLTNESKSDFSYSYSFCPRKRLNSVSGIVKKCFPFPMIYVELKVILLIWKIDIKLGKNIKDSLYSEFQLLLRIRCKFRSPQKFLPWTINSHFYPKLNCAVKFYLQTFNSVGSCVFYSVRASIIRKMLQFQLKLKAVGFIYSSPH